MSAPIDDVPAIWFVFPGDIWESIFARCDGLQIEDWFDHYKEDVWGGPRDPHYIYMQEWPDVLRVLLADFDGALPRLHALRDQIAAELEAQPS